MKQKTATKSIQQTKSFKKRILKHKKNIISWSVLAGFVFVLTYMVSPSNLPAIKIYKVGDIAQETIRASEKINVVDEEKTESARKEVERNVISIYDYDDTVLKTAKNKIQAAFSKMREMNQSKSSIIEKDKSRPTSKPSPKSTVKYFSSLYETFKESLDMEISEDEFNAISRTNFSNNVEQRLLRTIEAIEKKLIVNDLNSLKIEAERGIFLRNIGSQDPAKDIYIEDFSAILSLSQAVSLIKERTDRMFKGYRPKTRKIIAAFLEKFTRPNLFVNMQLTSAKIEEARENVKPITIPIQKNEVIVREGDRINKRHMVILEGIRKERKETNPFEIYVGIAITILLCVFLTYTFAKRYIRKFNPTVRDLAFLLLITVLTLVIANLFLFILDSFGDKFPSIPTSTYKYAIPVAAFAMLVRFTINSETAIIFTFLISIIMGFLFGGDLNYAIYCFIGSIFGAYKVAYSESKFSLMKAGILTGVINALAAVSLVLISGKAFVGGPSIFLSSLFMGLLNGVFIALILPTLSTVAEASGYLTDIKLIELANYNNLLLNKLALVAPGTYHHSRVVAQLAETAAQSIHANPLLAQVMSFYHDIGKIKQPEYFIENQQTNENKHDLLKPSMSKMIIISHVKDGVDMAKEAKVPHEILDSIEQHHGTSLISFFYKKAKDQENPDVDAVDESEYRYPGPKPQTREIGLLMLADSVEAATKSLVDPTPAQIQGVIQKVFNKTFTDGQLEDCELTLKDLHKIAASFFRVLISIYKARIDYPEIPQKETQKKKQNGDSNTKQTKEDKDKIIQSADDDKGTLKRIGIDKK